jgi:hypothetical protein
MLRDHVKLDREPDGLSFVRSRNSREVAARSRDGTWNAALQLQVEAKYPERRYAAGGPRAGGMDRRLITNPIFSRGYQLAISLVKGPQAMPCPNPLTNWITSIEGKEVE